MFQMTIRVPHKGTDKSHDTTWLSRKHESTVRRFLDDMWLYAVAEIGWHKHANYTSAVCTVTGYPELKAAA